MDHFVTLTILGLATAAIFALAAVGLVLTYTTTGIFNFAHGAAGMLGAFTYWQLRFGWGWPAPVALAVVLLVLVPGLGALIERTIMRSLVDAPEIVRLVVTISLLVAMLGLGILLWDPAAAYPTRLFFQGERLEILGVIVTWHEAIAFGLAVVIAVGLRLFLYRTRAGLDMRAAVDSRPLAQLHGARPDRSATLAWAIGTSLAALAGILIAPLQAMSHINLTLLIVSAYAAAIIGRLRSLPLTVAGALLLGLGDSYAIGYLPTENIYLSTFRFALPVVVLFIVLVVLRQPGLSGRSVQASKEDIPQPSLRGSLVSAATIVTVVVVLAHLLSDSDALRAGRILALGVIALSLVPLVGFAGQVSLCQMSFAGIGAIVMAHHGHGGNPVALLWAALLCAAVGALVALPALRLSGIYLALATGAFAVALDRWFFNLPAFELGPWTIRLFELGNIAVAPVDLPGIDGSDRGAQLVVIGVIFALFHLGVSTLRRSRAGLRMLAMKSSPAAAATIGVDLTRLKLATFALSAAMAGVGGALYGGTLGVVSPATFSFFESLPLLLLTVVGGIGTASGALFAGIFLGGFPVAVGIWPFLADLNRVLPGLLGLALARSPNGVVREISEGYRMLRRRVAGSAPDATGRAAVADPLREPEWAGIRVPLPHEAVRALDQRLGTAQVQR
jgi:branched-chain amino acid transport system permease protein